MRAALGFLALVLVALLLRSTVLTSLATRGVVIDVLACATVLWSLRSRETWGATFGFFLGLAADLDAAHWLGRHALALSLLGYAVGRLSHTLVRNSARTQAVLLAVATAVHQVWVASFELGGFAAWPYLIQRVVLAIIATSIVGTLVVAIVRRLSGAPLYGHALLETDAAH